MTNRELANWVVATCLTFGATIATVYQVAGLFVSGIGRDRERKNTPDDLELREED